ncbi:MATE family efflux transporter [Anaerobaca lacustris]|uniref:Multidrug-efflux transporter n=1 Tax=Anaerobaca lacustris TaxID=3044600 RepID=A0AAW6TZZ3_9BACT|nr:MATE family efflux transporter [Sedimentisphaerales bacterium M17dextr]
MTARPQPDRTGPPDYETSLAYMFKLAGPMVVSTVSMTVMQFVDRFMVSRLGTDALAAVLPAGFVSFLPGGFAMGVLTSLNTFVSQSFGRGEKANCSRYFWQALYMATAYCTLILAIMWPAAHSIFTLLGQPAAVVPMEVIYFRIMLLANFVAIVNWSSNHFFMGIHRPIIIMCSSLCGQAVNVFANYVLIFGKLGLPAMGIAGAAWGTFVGMSVAASINLAVFLSGPIHRQFGSRRTLRPDVASMRAILSIGVPAGIGLMTNVALWGVVLFTLVGRFGKEAMAATSAVLSYTNLSTMPIVGLSTALTAAVGKSIGAGRKDLAMRQAKGSLRVGLIYMGLVGACFLFLRDSLMVFWSRDPEVLAIGSQILVLAALYQMFHAARIIYGGALRGAGDTTWLAISSGIGAIGILGLGGALVVRLFPGLGALGPWSLAAISIAVVGVANRWRFKSKRWMQIDLFRHPTVPEAFSVEQPNG